MKVSRILLQTFFTLTTALSITHATAMGPPEKPRRLERFSMDGLVNGLNPHAELGESETISVGLYITLTAQGYQDIFTEYVGALRGTKYWSSEDYSVLYAGFVNIRKGRHERCLESIRKIGALKGTFEQGWGPDDYAALLTALGKVPDGWLGTCTSSAIALYSHVLGSSWWTQAFDTLCQVPLNQQREHIKTTRKVVEENGNQNWFHLDIYKAVVDIPADQLPECQRHAVNIRGKRIWNAEEFAILLTALSQVPPQLRRKYVRFAINAGKGKVWPSNLYAQVLKNCVEFPNSDREITQCLISIHAQGSETMRKTLDYLIYFPKHRWFAALAFLPHDHEELNHMTWFNAVVKILYGSGYFGELTYFWEPILRSTVRWKSTRMAELILNLTEETGMTRENRLYILSLDVLGKLNCLR